jgi:transcription termination factor NusB
MPHRKSQLARLSAVQALYQLHFMPQAGIVDIIELNGAANLDIDLLRWVVTNVQQQQQSLMALVAHLNLRGELVDMIILRCGLFELTASKLHYKIIIGSYMRVAHLIGSRSFSSVLNKVLDNFAKSQDQTKLLSN